jgi:hypothetical protein
MSSGKRHAYNPKLYIEKKCCQKISAACDGVASRDQEAVQ